MVVWGGTDYWQMKVLLFTYNWAFFVTLKQCSASPLLSLSS